MKKEASKSTHSTETIEDRILTIRDHRVILDRDLAELYGVPTKRLNEQVRRNRERFPGDFMFRLSKEEAEKWFRSRSQIATSSGHGGRRYLPYVFTEHGALMAANVLNSERAVTMSIYVIRAFVRIRQIFVVNQILEEKLAETESVLFSHDKALADLYKRIRQLLSPKFTRAIGFRLS
jgi:hypothetical protein